MGVVWQRSTNAQTDNVIAPSHHGPCLVYMARMDKPIDDPVWFKVYEQGYDSDSKLWCTDVLRANNGLLEFTIPADIRSGDYLLRTEIIALHAASKLGKVQFYPNCAQLSVEGSGSADPKGYSIPGIYKADDPGLLFNLYKPYTNYTIPGPPIYEAGSE
ncbi:hypothetical protein LPJ66_000866 [Kickxella alabastrina]|uniref:Uncharacterized protein n=1 Tax=Kickxella alabastrina TaxID=61397 RepID=A0ACC1IUT5_9FUNG|nr:hypothetical protein LPJ66_000866 [Kickxella alabastrina]